MLALASLAVAIQTQPVNAAAAKCLSTNTYKYFDCKSVDKSLFPGGKGPQANKCYIANASSISAVVEERACTEVEQIFAQNSAGANTTPWAGLTGDCKDADLSKNCGIVGYLVLFINVLSGIVGVVIVIMIIVGGIQYSSAGDDPQKVSAAKSKIINALLALAVFIFMFAFLQWVVPGGIF